jgi:hypothetical protein
MFILVVKSYISITKTNYVKARISVKYISSEFKQNGDVSTNFNKIPIRNFTKGCLVGVVLFHADRRADWQIRQTHQLLFVTASRKRLQKKKTIKHTRCETFWPGDSQLASPIYITSSIFGLVCFKSAMLGPFINVSLIIAYKSGHTHSCV